jgi:hypothetical protein
MRKVAIALAMLPLFATAQCEYSRDEVDAFTGRKITTTKLSKAKAKIDISASLYVSAGSVSNKADTTRTISLALIPSTAVGCVSSSSKAIFLWADGTTEEIAHAGSIECGNPSHLMIVQEGSRLLTEQPTKVRLYFTKGYVDVELLDESVIRSLNCLIR